MTFLLDTHVILFAADERHRLSTEVREQVMDTGASIRFSAASAYEIALKHSIGRLPQAENLLPRYEETLREAGWEEVALTSRHALTAGAFPLAHRDPFDRLIAAQALVEDLVLVSNDVAMDSFGVRRLW